MKNEIHFPAVDAFSFSLARGDAVTHTSENVSLLIAEEPSKILLSSRVYSLKAGDALLALPFSYRKTLDSSLAFCGYELCLPLTVLRAFAPNLSIRSADGGSALSLPHDSLARLLVLLEALWKAPADSVYSIMQIFSILEQEVLPETESDLAVPLPKFLRRALAYIQENVSEKMDTDTLSERYGVSESTLRRAFRAYLATTPQKYAREIQNLRLLRYKKNEVL